MRRSAGGYFNDTEQYRTQRVDYFAALTKTTTKAVEVVNAVIVGQGVRVDNYAHPKEHLMMNNKTIAIGTTVAATAALALISFAGMHPAVAQGPGGGGMERHPEIRRAIRALNVAEDHLKQANHDFGGHRVDAINACDQAIAQLKICLKYDKH